VHGSRRQDARRRGGWPAGPRTVTTREPADGTGATDRATAPAATGAGRVNLADLVDLGMGPPVLADRPRR
jgi:hypothetical protein